MTQVKSKTTYLILTITLLAICLSACEKPQGLQDIKSTLQHGNGVYDYIKEKANTSFPGLNTPVATGLPNNTVTIASFNIQVFGKTKSSKPEIMQILANTIRQFDVVAIQEIRDKSGTAIEALETEVDSLGTNYEYIIGPRLGRSSSKVQYAFIYNTQTIEPIGTGFTLDDPNDIFHREPFIGHFRSRTGNFEFFLLIIHVDPYEAEQELAALPSAIKSLNQEQTTRKNFIILGDLNADCSYWNEDENSPLRSVNYTWQINDNADTNLAKSSCTYDRIIITSQVTGNFTAKAGVYRFDEVFSLNKDEAKAVSDHYPVWAVFRTN